MKDRITSRLEKAARFFPIKLTMVFILGVVISGAFLDKTIFYLAPATRVTMAVVFMIFATGMMMSLTQFATNAVFGILDMLNWKYKPEKTHNPEADRIARKLGAPLPRSINITENPRVLAVTNAWTRTITISKKLTELLTGEQLLAVIAHEIGHLKYRKVFIAEILLVMLSSAGFSLYFFNILMAITPIMGLLAEWAFVLLVLIPILRYNEFMADAAAKKVGLGNDLADALSVVGKSSNDDGSETHPSTGSRIRRLFTPSPSLPGPQSGPSAGLLDRMADFNWDVHFTKPYRYKVNGVRDYILDFAREKRSLYILDVGCSNGVAAKTLIADLAKSGIRASIGGVDFSGKVRKKATKNLDEFFGVDILDTRQGDLPLADVVVCSYAAIFVPGERRYNIIRRCAEQLKEDGVLITNAFPFGRKFPSPITVFRIQVGAVRVLGHGWTSFGVDYERRRAETAKMMSVAVRGRSAALDYAESIRSSWEGLTEKQRAAWKSGIVLNGEGFRVVRLLKYLIRKLRSQADGVF